MYHTFSVVGPTENRWGQTFSEGGLILAIELPENASNHEKGREIIEDIEQTYQDQQPTTLPALKKLIHSIDIPEGTALVVALVLPDGLLLVNRARAHAYIYRDSTIAELLTKKGALSGPLHANDTLILTTPSFMQIFNKSTLKHALLETPQDELEDELATTVQNSDKKDGAACIVTRIVAKEITIESEALSDEPEQDFEGNDQTSKPSPPQEETDVKISHKPSFLKRARVSISTSNILYSKRRRLTGSIGLILAGLLIVSLLFGAQHKTSTLQHQSYEEAIQSIEEPFESAKSLIELNPQDAYEELVAIEANLIEARDLFDEESEEYRLLDEKITEVGVYMLESQRIYTISDIPVFFDLSWIKDAAHGARIALYEDLLIVVDPDNESAYSLSIDSKDSDIIASGDELLAASDVAIHGTNIYYFISDDEQRLLNDRLKKIEGPDNDWGQIISISAYTGNLYLLDMSGHIWKYAMQNNSLGSRESYLSSDVEINFDRAVDMTIDGSIWVLTENDVLKYTLGRPDVFFIQDEGVASPKAIYTNEELDYLYILEQDRILVIDKEGKYNEQYTWDGIENATDLIVSDSLNKIIVLSDGKLYGIDIRN